MKIARVIYSETEIRPNGAEAKVCTLVAPIADALPSDSGFELQSACVYGLAPGDIIGDGSVLLAPGGKEYVAWSDNYFTPADAEYDGEDTPWWYSYVVTYLYGRENGAVYRTVLVPVSGDGIHTVIGAPPCMEGGSPVPEDTTFEGWTYFGEVDGQVQTVLVAPGDEITVSGDLELVAKWTESGGSGGINPSPNPFLPSGGGLGKN